MARRRPPYRPNAAKKETPPGAVTRTHGTEHVTKADHGGEDGRGWRQFRKEENDA